MIRTARLSKCCTKGYPSNPKSQCHDGKECQHQDTRSCTNSIFVAQTDVCIIIILIPCRHLGLGGNIGTSSPYQKGHQVDEHEHHDVWVARHSLGKREGCGVPHSRTDLLVLTHLIGFSHSEATSTEGGCALCVFPRQTSPLSRLSIHTVASESPFVRRLLTKPETKKTQKSVASRSCNEFCEINQYVASHHKCSRIRKVVLLQ